MAAGRANVRRRMMTSAAGIVTHGMTPAATRPRDVSARRRAGITEGLEIMSVRRSETRRVN